MTARRVARAAVAVKTGVAVVVGQALLAGGRLLHNRAGALGIWLALEHGLADEALGALAPGPVQDHPADGVLTTGGPERAGVLADATVARLVQGAVIIALAATLI